MVFRKKIGLRYLGESSYTLEVVRIFDLIDSTSAGETVLREILLFINSLKDFSILKRSNSSGLLCISVNNSLSSLLVSSPSR